MQPLILVLLLSVNKHRCYTSQLKHVFRLEENLSRVGGSKLANSLGRTKLTNSLGKQQLARLSLCT